MNELSTRMHECTVGVRPVIFAVLELCRRRDITADEWMRAHTQIYNQVFNCKYSDALTAHDIENGRNQCSSPAQRRRRVFRQKKRVGGGGHTRYITVHTLTPLRRVVHRYDRLVHCTRKRCTSDVA
jgi:ribosomal protein L44E